MTIKNDIDSVNPYLFKEMLKMKRRQMSPAARKRSKSVNVTTLWLYPFAQERQYRKYLFDLMDVYSNIALPRLRNNLQRWIEENKLDRADWDKPINKNRADQFNTEFQQTIKELEQTQFNMFADDGSGVRDNEGHFWNALSIGASLTAIGMAVSTFNQKQEDKITKRILGQPFIVGEQQWLIPAIELWKNENFGLIKSLTNDYIKKLNFTVSDGIANDKSMRAIMKDILKMDKNITKTRAQLLSRDQVGKLNGRLTKRRSQEAGLDLYKWKTAGDERVRPTDPKLVNSTSVQNHRLMNNKICRWDNASVYADSVADARAGNWKQRPSKMQGAIPGSQIQCRCTAIPIVDDLINEIDKELIEENKRLTGGV